MTMIEELRKTVSERTPVYALVGVTDALVGQARKLGSTAGERVLGKVERVRREASHGSWQGLAQQLPSRAVDSGLHLVARAEEAYDDLAERGELVLNRRRAAKSGAETASPASPAPARRAPVVVDPIAAPKTRKAPAKPKTPAKSPVKSAGGATSSATPGPAATASAPKAASKASVKAAPKPAVRSPKPPAPPVAD